MPTLGSQKERYNIAIEDQLWGLSSYTSPVQVHNVANVFDMAAGPESGLGMRNYVGPLRSRFSERLLVEDDRDDGIDPDETLTQYLPCCVAHRGICPAQTPDIYED